MPRLQFTGIAEQLHRVGLEAEDLPPQLKQPLAELAQAHALAGAVEQLEVAVLSSSLTCVVIVG